MNNSSTRRKRAAIKEMLDALDDLLGACTRIARARKSLHRELEREGRLQPISNSIASPGKRGGR